MKKIVLVIIMLLIPSLAFGAGANDGFWLVGPQILIAIEQQGAAFFGGLAHYTGTTIDGWALITGTIQDSTFSGSLLDFSLLPYGTATLTFTGDSGTYRRFDLQGNLVYELPMQKLHFGTP